MKVTEPPTPDQVREQSRAWYMRQVEILSMSHGARWPSHKDWIEDYLKAEVRERLLALGWKAKQ